MLEIWFWQRMISPHMADLAVALSRLGYRVTYVAESVMSNERARQGWSVPILHDVTLQVAGSIESVQRLVNFAPADSIHICQGVRANGLIGLAQRALTVRGIRQWVVMETVDDAGWLGILKRAEYKRVLRKRIESLQGVLATGYRTADWLIERGIPAQRVYSFAYFLPRPLENAVLMPREPGPFRFVFAGRLIPLKRVDWLVNALAGLTCKSFELWVVGAGSEESMLRTLVARQLGSRVRWFGQLTLPEVPAVMSQADCLVLPSQHDGWGAVASESLLVGTPVICSDACGVAGVVRASSFGGVFPVNDPLALANLLHQQLMRGTVFGAERQQIASWATCLEADAGATYLQQIIESKESECSIKPCPPWAVVRYPENTHTNTVCLHPEQ